MKEYKPVLSQFSFERKRLLKLLSMMIDQDLGTDFDILRNVEILKKINSELDFYRVQGYFMGSEKYESK